MTERAPRGTYPLWRPCEKCGLDFLVTHNHPHARYCSRRCSLAAIQRGTVRYASTGRPGVSYVSRAQERYEERRRLRVAAHERGGQDG